MKKLILIILGILLWTMGYSQTEDYDVVAWDNLTTLGNFIIGEDTLRNTTQIGVLDTTIVTLAYLDSIQGLPIDSAYFKINPTLGTAHLPGRVYWDVDDHSLSIDTDLDGVSLQVGQETLILVYNKTGVTIENGKVVRVNGIFNDRPTVAKAIATDHINAPRDILITTMEIENDSLGFAVELVGRVRDIEVAGLGENWLSAITAGEMTTTKPIFPDYQVSLGGAVKTGVTDGIFQARLDGINPFNTILNYFNTIIRETFDFIITSDGVNVTGTLQQTGGGDLTLMLSDGLTTLDCTPAQTIDLTAYVGTDTVPVMIYVHIPKSTKVLAVATTDWPAGESIKITDALMQSASSIASNGVYFNRNWNDHLASVTDLTGDHSHVGFWIRSQDATYKTGIDGTITIVSASSPDDIYFANTSGVVLQKHPNPFEALDMQTGKVTYVVNDNVTAYKPITNLNGELTDAQGGSMSGKYFNLLVWGSNNKTGEADQLYWNLPDGSYNSLADATSDISGYNVNTIPIEFTGKGFLMFRYTFKHSLPGSGTWTLENTKDLRGLTPATAGSGGGGGAAATSLLALTDTPSSYVGFASAIGGVNSAATGFDFKLATVDDNGTINIPAGEEYQIDGNNLKLTDLDSTDFRLTQSQIIGLEDSLLVGKSQWTDEPNGIAYDLPNSNVGVGTSPESNYRLDVSSDLNYGVRSVMEGVADAAAFYGDGGTGSSFQAFGSNAIDFDASGSGIIQLRTSNISATPVLGKAWLYVNFLDKLLYYKNDLGDEYDLTSTGSDGTVTNVSSSTPNQLTVANGTTTPDLTIVTGAVADLGTALATGDQIYDFVIGEGFEQALTFSTGLTRTTNTITTNDSEINHDGLLNFLTSEHYLQSAISITESQISDFGDYLLKTGGTLTGALGGTSAIFSGGINNESSNYVTSKLTTSTHRAGFSTSAIADESVFGHNSTGSKTALDRYLRIGANKLQYTYDANTYNIYHSGNSNLSTVDWAAKDGIFSGGVDAVGVTSTANISVLSSTIGNGFPVTSGTTQTYGLFRLKNSVSNVVLDQGINTTSGVWLQSTLATNLSSEYPLLLNPNGGKVGIGTTSTLQAHLEINTEAAETTKLRVNGEASQQKRIEVRQYNASEAGLENNLVFLASKSNDTGTLGMVNASGIDVDVMTMSETGDVTFPGSVDAASFSVSSLNTAPSSATDTGTTGEIRYTSTHIYVCVATNTWKRTQIDTW